MTISSFEALDVRFELSVSSHSENPLPLSLSLGLVVNFYMSNFLVSVSSQKIGLVSPGKKGSLMTP